MPREVVRTTNYVGEIADVELEAVTFGSSSRSTATSKVSERRLLLLLLPLCDCLFPWSYALAAGRFEAGHHNQTMAVWCLLGGTVSQLQVRGRYRYGWCKRRFRCVEAIPSFQEIYVCFGVATKSPCNVPPLPRVFPALLAQPNLEVRSQAPTRYEVGCQTRHIYCMSLLGSCGRQSSVVNRFTPRL